MNKAVVYDVTEYLTLIHRDVTVLAFNIVSFYPCEKMIEISHVLA